MLWAGYRGEGDAERQAIDQLQIDVREKVKTAAEALDRAVANFEADGEMIVERQSQKAAQLEENYSNFNLKNSLMEDAKDSFEELTTEYKVLRSGTANPDSFASLFHDFVSKQTSAIRAAQALDGDSAAYFDAYRNYEELSEARRRARVLQEALEVVIGTSSELYDQNPSFSGIYQLLRARAAITDTTISDADGNQLITQQMLDNIDGVISSRISAKYSGTGFKFPPEATDPTNYDESYRPIFEDLQSKIRNFTVPEAPSGDTPSAVEAAIALNKAREAMWDLIDKRGEMATVGFKLDMVRAQYVTAAADADRALTALGINPLFNVGTEQGIENMGVEPINQTYRNILDQNSDLDAAAS